MANHKSAIKRHKQSLKHAARNRAARTRVKNAVKAVRAAIKDYYDKNGIAYDHKEFPDTEECEACRMV